MSRRSSTTSGRLVLALAVISGALLCMVPNDVVRACSCTHSEEPIPPERFRRLAPSIFLAKVVGVHGPYMMGQRDGSIRFEHDRWFEMERVLVWEGGTSERVFVRTGSGGGDCGYAFALGGLYLVYAHGDRDTLNTGICMRTRPWTSAYEDSVALGAPKFDRTSGIPWRLLAPPVSCPVHRDVPVRRDHSIVAYGMAERVMENYAERMSREFPYAGIQFEFARADSGRTEFTDAYTCPTCRSIAKAWCRKQHVFLIADGDKPWELPLPTPAR